MSTNVIENQTINTLNLKQKLLLSEDQASNHFAKKCGVITGIVLSILATLALVGIGVPSLLQAYGIQMPHCFDWIAHLSQTPGAWASWTLAAAGTLLGIVTILIGRRQLHSLKKKLENELQTKQVRTVTDEQWQQLANLMKANVSGHNPSKLGYDAAEKIKALKQDESLANGSVVRYMSIEGHTQFAVPGEGKARWSYYIKTFAGEVIPVPAIELNDKNTQQFLVDSLGALGYAFYTRT